MEYEDGQDSVEIQVAIDVKEASSVLCFVFNYCYYIKCMIGSKIILSNPHQDLSGKLMSVMGEILETNILSWRNLS